MQTKYEGKHCSRCNGELPKGPRSMVCLTSDGEMEPHKTHLVFEVCFVCITDIRKFTLGILI